MRRNNDMSYQEESLSLKEQISGITDLINSPYWKFCSSRVQQNWQNQLQELENMLSPQQQLEPSQPGRDNVPTTSSVVKGDRR